MNSKIFLVTICVRPMCARRVFRGEGGAIPVNYEHFALFLTQNPLNDCSKIRPSEHNDVEWQTSNEEQKNNNKKGLKQE